MKAAWIPVAAVVLLALAACGGGGGTSYPEQASVKGPSVEGKDPAKPGIYDPAQLKRALSPHGRVHVFHYARRPVRDRLPFRKTTGGRIFLFQVTPPNPPAER